MPCCAFAAFIVSQVVLGFGAFKRFVLRSTDDPNDAPINAATEWRLTSATALPAPSRRRWGLRTLALAASIEILLAAGALHGYRAHSRHHHHHENIASMPVSVPVR